jgi:hypothetical protein
MRLWFRLGMVVLIVLLGIRAWVLRPGDEPAGPGADAALPIGASPAGAPPDAAPADTPQGPTAGATAASVLTEALRNAEGRSAEGLAWRVTGASAAEGILVVEVAADRPGDALAIAGEIVAPLDDTYEEVLVYVRGATPAPGALTHRVQWTPAGGFTEITYTE